FQSRWRGTIVNLLTRILLVRWVFNQNGMHSPDSDLFVTRTSRIDMGCLAEAGRGYMNRYLEMPVKNWLLNQSPYKPLYQFPSRRYQRQKSDQISKNSWNDQQHASQKDENPVYQRLGRHVSLGQLIASSVHCF